MSKIEYPKYKYHAKHEPVVVHNKQEELALGSGWHESPADIKDKAPKVPKGATVTEVSELPEGSEVHDEVTAEGDFKIESDDASEAAENKKKPSKPRTKKAAKTNKEVTA